MKRISNWHLSILVVLVSVLSLVLVQRYVLAQWQDPSAPPGSTGINNIVVNPLAADIDMADRGFLDTGIIIKKGTVLDKNGVIQITSGAATGDGINVKVGDGAYAAIKAENSGTTGNKYAGYFTGNVKVVGNLDVSGTYTGTSVWTKNADNTIYYSLGNVGIRETAPGYPLHIVDNDNTSILNINNVGTLLWTGTRLARDGNEKWFVGMDNSTDKFFIRRSGGTNDITVDTAGKVGIGNDSPAYKLDISDGGSYNPVLYAHNTLIGGTAIKGEASGTSGSYYSKGVEGIGKYAVYGQTNYSDGIGIYGLDASGGSNSKAGYFKGDVQITSGVGSQGFLQINSLSVAPSGTYCQTSLQYGRMIYDSTDNRLYICTTGGWRYITLTNNLP